MENSKKSPITIGATDGENISVVGDTYRILVSGAQTGGAFATIDMLIPPDGGPGPHAHTNFEESFYVISGEIEVNRSSALIPLPKVLLSTSPKAASSTHSKTRLLKPPIFFVQLCLPAWKRFLKK